jgi:hypothetical protein
MQSLLFVILSSLVIAREQLVTREISHDEQQTATAHLQLTAD